MTDNLRDRIVAVMKERTERDGVTDWMLVDLADAVIAALKLHVVTVGDFQTVIKGSYPRPLEES